MGLLMELSGASGNLPPENRRAADPEWDSAALEADLIVDQVRSFQGPGPRKAHIECCWSGCCAPARWFPAPAAA
jgi:hypothetical protein